MMSNDQFNSERERERERENYEFILEPRQGNLLMNV